MTSDDGGTLVQRIKDAPRPLAFVLSGGGAYGAVQVGMLRALAEADIEPDLVVGASVGALNGVFVADNAATAATRLSEIWSSIDGAAVFGSAGRSTATLHMARHLVKTRTSLVSAQAMEELIRTRTPQQRFDQLALPFHAVATDHVTGDIVVLDDGQLEPALAASAAIPGVLPPQEINGRRLIDGGVVAMFPTSTAQRLGARSIVLLDATPTDPRPEPPQGFSQGLIHTVALMIRAQRQAATQSVVVGCPVFTLASATPPDATAFQFHRIASLINDGYQRARGHLHS